MCFLNPQLYDTPVSYTYPPVSLTYTSPRSPLSWIFRLVCSFNQAKPKSEVEARVYEVLSHKNWGSSSTLMNEIARDTYDYDKCK